MENLEFGKATDLIKSIQEQIAIHGDDLRVAFCLDDDEVNALKGAVGGAVQVDGVELTKPPRLDLMWARPNQLSREELSEIIDEYKYYAENDEPEEIVDEQASPHPVYDVCFSDVKDGDFKHIPRCVDWNKGLLDYLLSTVGKSPEISIGCYLHGQATFIAFDIQGEKVGVSYTIGLTKNYIELPNDVSHAGEFFVPGTVDAFEIIGNIVTNTSAVMKIKRF
jgi:hypothetical protein